MAAFNKIQHSELTFLNLSKSGMKCKPLNIKKDIYQKSLAIKYLRVKSSKHSH